MGSRFDFRDHKWMVSFVLLALIILFRLVWVYIIPFDQAPDERGHFALMSFIADKHTLPVSGDPKLKEFAGYYSTYYGALPSVPFIFGAIGVTIGKLFVNKSSLYLFARFMSVLLGIGTAYLSLKIARLLFPKDNFLQIGIPVAVLFIPQSSFIFAYANNDAMTTFAMTLCYYYMTKCTVEKWTTKNAVFLGAAIGLSLLSKLNAYIIIPLTGVFFIISFWKEYKKGFKYLALTGMTTGIVSGWWFIRNLIIYKGDFLALKASQLTNGSSSYHHQGGSIVKLLLHSVWVEWSFKSTWAYFGYMMYQLSRWYYRAIIMSIIISLIGLIIFLYKTKSGKFIERSIKIMGLTFGLSIFFAVALSIWSSYANDFNPQGKYLYTAFVPFVTIFVFGLSSLFNSFLPIKKRSLLILFVFFFLFMNIYSVIFLHKNYTNPLINSTAETNQVMILRIDKLPRLRYTGKLITVPAIAKRKVLELKLKKGKTT